MIERLAPHRRNLALALLGILVLWFAWEVRSVLNPLILGYLLAYILNPMVRNLERRGWGRESAANLIFVVFFFVTTVTTFAVFQQGRQLVEEVSTTDLGNRIQKNLPGWIISAVGEEDATGEGSSEEPEDDSVRDSEESATAPGGGAGGDGQLAATDAEPGSEGSTAESVGDGPSSDAVVPVAGEEDAEEAAEEASAVSEATQEVVDALEPDLREALGQALSEFWEQFRSGEGGEVRQIAQRAGSIWPHVQDFFGSIVAFGTLIFLLPIYAYYLLFELDRVHAFVLRYVPEREKARFERIGTQVGGVISNFFRGRLTICFLKGAFITVGLWVMGVPYFFFLGMGSGFLSLAPFVGPIIGFFAAFVLELVDVGVLSALIKTGLIFGVAEVLEGYVFMPRILGDSLGLHPVAILASVFVGGAALGMFGFLIAVPLTAALLIFIRELVLPALADWADEVPGPDPPVAAEDETTA